jgi:hypothetical protein
MTHCQVGLTFHEKVGALELGLFAGVECKIKPLKSWGQPLLNQIGALSRGIAGVA